MAAFTTSFVCSQSFSRSLSAPKYLVFPISSPLEPVRHAPGLFAVFQIAFHIYSPHSVAETLNGRNSGIRQEAARINGEEEDEAKVVRTKPGDDWMNFRSGYCAEKDYTKKKYKKNIKTKEIQERACIIKSL